MGDNCDIYFLILSRSCDKELIKGIVDTLLEAGCIYHKPQDYYKSGYWTDKKSDWFYERSLSEAIQAISADCGGAIRLWYGGIDFVIGIRPQPSIDEKFGSIVLSFNRVFFNDVLEINQKLERSVEIVIELSKKLYAYLSPIYGFGEYGVGWREIPSKEDILSGNVMRFCWTNFVPNNLVEKMGRKKLLSAPAWKVEELNDGGVLLVLAQNPLNINEVESKKIELMKYFGM